MWRELLRYGVSQISAGSSTGVGGYKEREEGKYDSVQFKTSDDRTPLEVIKSVLDDGYIPTGAIISKKPSLIILSAISIPIVNIKTSTITPDTVDIKNE